MVLQMPLVAMLKCYGDLKAACLRRWLTQGELLGQLLSQWLCPGPHRPHLPKEQLPFNNFTVCFELESRHTAPSMNKEEI